MFNSEELKLNHVSSNNSRIVWEKVQEFWTDWSRQTMQTHEYDHSLYSLPFRLHLLDTLLHCDTALMRGHNKGFYEEISLNYLAPLSRGMLHLSSDLHC